MANQEPRKRGTENARIVGDSAGTTAIDDYVSSGGFWYCHRTCDLRLLQQGVRAVANLNNCGHRTYRTTLMSLPLT